MRDELTPAGMEAAARPFAEPCARKLREWAESDHGTAMVNRLDLKRVMQEYDSLRAELAEAKAEIARLTEERDRKLDAFRAANRALIGARRWRLRALGLIDDAEMRVYYGDAWQSEATLLRSVHEGSTLNVQDEYERLRALVAAVEEGARTDG